MPVHNPVDLPEISSFTGQLLTRKELYACILVCKSWRDSFQPLLWQTLRLRSNPSDYLRNPTLQAIYRNARLIYTIYFEGYPLDLNDIHLPKLKIIRFNRQWSKDGSETALVLQHQGTLQSIEIHEDSNRDGRDKGIWEAVSQCSQLSSLEVSEAALGVSMDFFWQSVLFVKSLCLSNVTPTSMSPSSMQTLRPSKIRKLTLLHVSNLSTLDQLQLIKLCPELESLNWDLLSRAEAWIEFATATAAGTWPNLESLNLAYEGSADYDALSKVLGSLRKLTELRVHGIGMGPTFYQALRRYFSTIQVLYLARTDVCSSMVQEVLTHCTSLTSFTAYKIRGEDVVEGQPWGCLQLKELRLYFDLDPTHQRRVYEQLARLTQLRSLRDGICHDNDLNDDLRISLDFRLKSGLELLSGLKRLKHLTIERECGSKAIAEDDVRWMVKHWTSLETVDGDRMERFRRKHAASIQYSMEWYGTEGYSLLSPMNNDDKINKELRYIFSSHGVTLR